MAVGAVGRGEVSALHHRLCDTPTTANYTVKVLSKMCSLAEAWEWIPQGRNPCRSVLSVSIGPISGDTWIPQGRNPCRSVIQAAFA